MELITSRKNPLLAHYRKLGASKAYRRECGEFLLDGKKLLEDAIACGYPIKSVLLTEPCDISTPDCAYTTPELMDSISPLKSPQGVLFICPLRQCGLPERFEHGRYIVLDAVRDPGNAGTVIRSADAFGIDGVILTEDCADPFNIKTVRASMGGIFRQKIYCGGRTEIRDALIRSGMPVFAAALTEHASDIRGLDLSAGAFIIGNEGAGISEELSNIGAHMRIPMNDTCQSLNAAVSASVIMWEIYKKAAR